MFTVRIPLGISVFDNASALRTAANTLASWRTGEAIADMLEKETESLAGLGKSKGRARTEILT